MHKLVSKSQMSLARQPAAAAAAADVEAPSIHKVAKVSSGQRHWILVQPDSHGSPGDSESLCSSHSSLSALSSQSTACHEAEQCQPSKKAVEIPIADMKISKQKQFLRSRTVAYMGEDKKESQESSNSCRPSIGQRASKLRRGTLARMQTQEIIDEIDDRNQEVQELLQLGQATISGPLGDEGLHLEDSSLKGVYLGSDDNAHCQSVEDPDHDAGSDESPTRGWKSLSTTADNLMSGLHERLSFFSQGNMSSNSSDSGKAATEAPGECTMMKKEDSTDSLSTSCSSQSHLSNNCREGSVSVSDGFNADVKFQDTRTIASFVGLTRQQTMVNDLLLQQVQAMQKKIGELQQELGKTQEERDNLREYNHHLQEQMMKILGCTKGGWVF